MDRTVDFYKNKMANMLDEIESLKEQVSELKNFNSRFSFKSMFRR